MRHPALLGLALAIALALTGCGEAKNLRVSARQAPGAEHWTGLRFRIGVGDVPPLVDRPLVLGKPFSVHVKQGPNRFSVVTCRGGCREICVRQVTFPSGHKLRATVTFYGRRCSLDLSLAD
jgi:hypothetical protein